MHTARSLLCLFPLSLALLLGACSDGTVKPPQVDNNADPTGSDSDPLENTGTPAGSDSDPAGPVTSDDNPVTSDDDNDSDYAVRAVPCTEDIATEVCRDVGSCAEGYCCDAPCTGSCEVCNAARTARATPTTSPPTTTLFVRPPKMTANCRACAMAWVAARARGITPTARPAATR